MSKIQLFYSDNIGAKVVESSVGHGHLDFIAHFHVVDVGGHQAFFVNFYQQFEGVSFDVTS